MPWSVMILEHDFELDFTLENTYFKSTYLKDQSSTNGVKDYKGSNTNLSKKKKEHFPDTILKKLDAIFTRIGRSF